MDDFKFKLVFPPNQKSTKDNLQNIECFLQKQLYIPDFRVTKWEILEASKFEISPKFTEIEVEVTAESISYGGKIIAYEKLTKNWINISRQLTQPGICFAFVKLRLEKPLLMIFSPTAFPKSSISIHSKIPIYDVQFGIFPTWDTFKEIASVREIASLTGKDPVLLGDFYHDMNNRVEIPFIHNYTKYVLTVQYKSIRRITVNFEDQNTVLYLDLIHPPLLHMILEKKSKYIGAYTINHRKLEVSLLEKKIFGKANILRISLVNNNQNQVNINQSLISRLRYRCHNLPIYYSSIIVSKELRPYYPRNLHLQCKDFSGDYLLTAIVERNFSFGEQCRMIKTEQLNQLREVLLNSEVKHVERALTDILFEVDSGKYVFFPQAVISLIEYYINNPDKNKFMDFIVPEKSRMIRRATFTPTRCLFWPPEIMFENRVLRNYEPDFALRVNFRDDDMNRLSFNALYCDDLIFYCAIREPMLKGIQIGSRNFEFLGWSNSQIRDHGVWCYAKDNSGRTAADIRKWMGDFSNIKTVPKYMARMGQSFSQTEDAVTVPLNPDYVRFERDIEGGLDPVTYKPYCFSDGIGKISEKLARQVHDALGHDKHCSAFQIRYGGCKGMLVIDPTLHDADIVFRESMRKFASPENIRLEIAKTSAPSPLQLNRPFITLLDQLGVPPRILLQLQECHLRKLTDILLDENEAVDYLRSKSPQTDINFEDLSKSGVHLTTEPFFRSLLLSLHTYFINKIKTHANIAIDPSEGRNMLGVLDETATLEYGQVFVQYTKDLSRGETTLETHILNGVTVLVTKNPCMHPGDVRKFTAVDVPGLHHIRDCIVFPQKGPRPHPNEMAGSDLDGDEYAVIWKKELIFKNPNMKAANYPSFSAPEVSNIQTSHMIGFLIEYIKNDQVGIIANAHLAQADLRGINHPLCITIAENFSVVVDYAKNGTKRQLTIEERPKQFPDFMEKHAKTSYKSKRALGKIYHVCKDFENASTSAYYKPSIIQVDPDLVYPGWEAYKENASEMYEKYSRQLTHILLTYGVQHEAEAFSGTFTRVHCRFQERKDKAEIEKVINASVKALCKSVLKDFVSDIDNPTKSENLFSEDGSIINRALQKASACYIVTYENPSAYLSFPWIISKFLASIKQQKMYLIQKPMQIPILEKIDSMISNNINEIPPTPREGVIELSNWNLLDDKSVVEQALKVMMLWAWDSYIIQAEGYRNRGFLYRNIFAKLFLFTVEKIITEKTTYKMCPLKQNVVLKSPAALCISFLRYCVTLRFCNKNEVSQYLPFHVYKYKELAKQAMVSYHDLAITGMLRILCFDKQQTHDTFEMKEEYLNSSVFGTSPISISYLGKIEAHLISITGVEELKLREIHTTNKVLINAIGTNESVSRLRRIIRKESTEWLPSN